jgi:hypothetical protein
MTDLSCPIDCNSELCVLIQSEDFRSQLHQVERERDGLVEKIEQNFRPGNS